MTPLQPREIMHAKPLSNQWQSGIHKIAILPAYSCRSLNRMLTTRSFWGPCKIISNGFVVLLASYRDRYHHCSSAALRVLLETSFWLWALVMPWGSRWSAFRASLSRTKVSSERVVKMLLPSPHTSAAQFENLVGDLGASPFLISINPPSPNLQVSQVIICKLNSENRGHKKQLRKGGWAGHSRVSKMNSYCKPQCKHLFKE